MTSKDIHSILADWPQKIGEMQVRRIVGTDGESFIQLRLDLGMLQMKLDGRPDGERPFGCESMLEFLSSLNDRQGSLSELTEEQAQAVAREMLQYYRRRISLIALAEEAKNDDDADQADACLRRAIRDADHNLALLDLLRDSPDNGELWLDHEQYRPFIQMHRYRCLAERSLLVQDPDGAIEYLKAGILSIQRVPRTDMAAPEGIPVVDVMPFVRELKRFERQIRKSYRRRRTLREQLEDAIDAENFEQAARLRDMLADQPPMEE